MRNFLDTSCREIKTHISCWTNFFRKSWGVWNSVQKCGRIGQATDAYVMWRTRF